MVLFFASKSIIITMKSPIMGGLGLVFYHKDFNICKSWYDGQSLKVDQWIF